MARPLSDAERRFAETLLRPDLPRVAVACRKIVALRARQAWPPTLSIEPSWPEQHRALAVDQGVAVVDVAEALSGFGHR